MSDANQDREPQNQTESNGEKKQPSFAKVILNFIIYFGLGYLILTALGAGR